MDRRDFLKNLLALAALAPAARISAATAVSAAAAPGKVSRRRYKNTDLTVPLLGYGMMRLPRLNGEIDYDTVKKQVAIAMASGVNYFDTAYFYHGGQSEVCAGEVLSAYPRNSYMLADKMPVMFLAGKTEEDQEAVFDDQLRKCGVGYFDYYLLHNLGDSRTAPFDDFHIWDFLAEKKEAGLIKNLGFSMHDKAEKLDEILTAHPEMDFVQLQINYADWDSPTVEARKCYEVARKHHKPIIIMEPVKGGSLAKLPEHIETLLRKQRPEDSTASWALRYAASLPGVMMVLSGMSNVEQMQDNIKHMGDFRPLNEVEHCIIAEAVSELEKMPQVPCTDCKYCVKGCPQNIAIPGVFRAMNNLMIYGNEEGARGNFAWETKDGGVPSKCIGCGACEEVCPQHIKIIDQLKKAVEMFE